MSLRLRKVLYIVLGSGAIYGAALSMLGLASFLVQQWMPDARFGAILVCLMLAGGCVGSVAGAVAIIGLPERARRARVALTIAILAAYPIAAVVLIGGWSGGGSAIAWFWICALPMAVGVALIVELWRPLPGAETSGDLR